MFHEAKLKRYSTHAILWIGHSQGCRYQTAGRVANRDRSGQLGRCMEASLPGSPGSPLSLFTAQMPVKALSQRNKGNWQLYESKQVQVGMSCLISCYGSRRKCGWLRAHEHETTITSILPKIFGLTRVGF
jgi:hypothetical protein